MHNSTHDPKKNHFPCMHCLPHHPSSNCVDTPTLLACLFSQQTSQGARGACVATGLLGLHCSPYFCSASMMIKNLSLHALAPHHQSAQLNKQIREFVSLPAQWHKERRRWQRNNQSGWMTRGSGKKTGRGAGRHKAGVVAHKLNNKN